MTHDDIIKALFDETLVGNAPTVLELTKQGIADGMTPSTILFDALIPALEEVGARFERGDFFVPDIALPEISISGWRICWSGCGSILSMKHWAWISPPMASPAIT